MHRKNGRIRTALLTWGALQYFRDESHMNKTEGRRYPYDKNLKSAIKGAR